MGNYRADIESILEKMAIPGCLYGCQVDPWTNRCPLCLTQYTTTPLLVRRTPTGSISCECIEATSLPKVICSCTKCENAQTVYLDGYSEELVESYAMLIGTSRTMCCRAPMNTEIVPPEDLDS